MPSDLLSFLFTFPATCYTTGIWHNDDHHTQEFRTPGYAALYVLGLVLAIAGVLVMISGVVKSMSTKFDDAAVSFRVTARNSTQPRNNGMQTELGALRTGDDYALLSD